MLHFSESFLWGAATSSHQVEGNNTNNDWWEWEQAGRLKQASGEATRHYEFFDDDFSLARELKHNAHRFSIEWSRVEPDEGNFNENEIQHYRQVVDSLFHHGLKPVVTLHHFTNPLWFVQKGGWLNPDAPRLFVRYAQKIASALKGGVEFWLTINEPMVMAYQGYLTGIWPPGEKSFKKMWKVVGNLVGAHRLAYETIHNIYRENHQSRPKVSVAKALVAFKVCPSYPNSLCRLSVFLRHRLFNLYFLDQVKSHLDFIGVNYYLREFISNQKGLGYGPWGGRCNKVHGHVAAVDAMGWDSFPRGLGEILGWFKKYCLPVMITENGTCNIDDNRRFEFIRDHLEEVNAARQSGIDVIGYLYWSLLDNFEWHHGYGPRFGLVEVDYKTFKRTPRPSARRLAQMMGDLSPIPE